MAANEDNLKVDKDLYDEIDEAIGAEVEKQSFLHWKGDGNGDSSISNPSNKGQLVAGSLRWKLRRLALSRNGRRAWLLCGVVAVAILCLYSFAPSDHPLLNSLTRTRTGFAGDVDTLGLRIAVIEQTHYHDEVIGSVLATLSDMNANTTFYRGALNWNFDQILTDVYPAKPLHPLALVDDINNGQFDVVVLVTCDSKFWGGWPTMMEALQSSKVHIVCIVHEVEQWGSDPDRNLVSIPAQQDRLTILTLGQHSKTALSDRLLRWSQSYRQPEWEIVPVVHYAPVFRIPESARLNESSVIPSKAGNVPSKVAILGRIIPYSRDYESILKELLQSMTDDPHMWGYRHELLLGDNEEESTPRFVPHGDPAFPPFTLHLIGKDEGRLTIPLPFIDPAHPIVYMHTELDYPAYYRLIGDMDIVLPAFNNFKYLCARASAAIPAAVISGTTILATPMLLKAYTYLAPQSYILSPQSMSEVASLAALRQAQDPWQAVYSTLNHSPRNYDTTKGPPRNGAIRDWERYWDSLSEQNVAIWQGILSRRVGTAALMPVS